MQTRAKTYPQQATTTSKRKAKNRSRQHPIASTTRQLRSATKAIKKMNLNNNANTSGTSFRHINMFLQ